MLLLAAIFAAIPQGRNWPVIGAAAGVGILFSFIGSGRLYRPAVTRADDTVICRFNPWREATLWAILLGLPLFALIPIAGARFLGRGEPGFWRLLGIVLLAMMPVFLFSIWRQSRHSSLRICSATLTVRQPGHPQPTDIPRSAVDEIAAIAAKLRNNDGAPATRISYQDQDPDATKRAVVFGPTNTKKTAWLTIDQPDLLAALQAWKDGDPNDPCLMNRVEAILRGQVTSAD